MATSREFWNTWNATYRADSVGDVPQRQAEVIRQWIADRRDLRILDAGCGTGWMCEHLVQHGDVVGTDLADEVVDQARDRVPNARFVAGDIMTVDVGSEFDLIVSLEVLSHVEDQPAFIGRLHSLLASGGQLILATQNEPVLSRFNTVPPPGDGQIRNWVNRRELERLLTAHGFVVEEMRALTPKADHGVMRAVAKLGRVTRTSGLLERLGFGWSLLVRARLSS